MHKVGKPERKNHLEDPGIDGKIILKCIFEKWDGDGGMCWIDFPRHRDRWLVDGNAVMNLGVP